MIHLLRIQDSERASVSEEERASGRSRRGGTRGIGEGEGTGVLRVQACLHFITRYKHAEARATASRGYSPIVLVCIYRGGIQPIMSVYCQTSSLFARLQCQGRVTLTALLAHFERFSHADRHRSDGYFGDRVRRERKRRELFSLECRRIAARSCDLNARVHHS